VTVEFRMPSLGADMEAGTLVQWRVKPGDVVKRGDIVAEVETDKGLIEIEIFEDGVIESILVPEGRKVPVGTVLALVRTAVEAPAPAPAPAAVEMPNMRARVSPLARKRAQELGVDLGAVRGTGEGGAITVADVERTATGLAVSPPPEPIQPPAVAAEVPPAPEATPGTAAAAAMRRAIAAAMTRSKREIPHYYLSTRVDLSRALAWLAAANASRPLPERMLDAALLLRAVALALKEVPELNGFWVDDAFRPGAGIHLGLAVFLRSGGLVTPAIHDADRKTLDQLNREMLDLVKRARAGVLRSSELSDPTITITNLGERGVETVFGVIYPPQVALVGFGKIVEQPWAANGMVGARPVVHVTLSADHRAIDGHRGARFLAAVDRLLQEPEKL
jgi:pyruvate dehydrogenase E2 component (dihydrolipoamide acetyltransferase)